MKATVISVLVLTLLLIAWFWPVQKEAQSVIIVADLSSQLAERDRHLARDLPVWLNEAAAQAHQRLNILFLDSHQPAGKLVEQLETHLASGVHIVMGCGDSACVRTLIPALERHKAVLLYPASSEGLIDSDQVVHLGPVASQYLFPSISWIRHNLGRNIMFIGSESARSHMLARLISGQLNADKQLSLIDREFMRDSSEISSIIDKAKYYKSDVIVFDACEWIAVPGFISGLESSGASVFSLCIDQRPADDSSLYYVSGYYDNRHNPENVRLKSLLGELNPVRINSYWMAQLWQQALDSDHLNSSRQWKEHLRSSNALIASGPAQIDQHLEGTWRPVYIIKKSSDRLTDGEVLMWMSDQPLRPVMFPGLEAPSDWLHFLTIYWRNAGGEWRSAITGASSS